MALLHRPITLLGLGITLLCLSSHTLSKDFYKWQDAEGVTHYSSQPSKEYKSVKVRASNIKDSGTSADSGNTGQAANPETETTPAGSTAAAEPVKDPERCASAQKNRKTLEENSRIRMKDGEEYRYLTPEEIQLQKETADQIIAEEC